ncbi:hypothetical protein Tco_0868578 [Tanacetum coccineum]
MVAAGGNFMRKTPQEAYDLIENITQHYFQWDAESEQIEVLRKQTANTSQSVQHQLGPAHPNTFHYTYSDESDEDEIENMTQHHFQWDAEVYYDTTTGVSARYSETTSLLKAEKSKINLLIREPSDVFLMGDKEIKFNPLKDIDDPVRIPRVSEKPLDSLDLILKTFDITITNPLFDFDSKFTLNLDNHIFDIQNEESDESEMKTITKEVRIHSSQSTTQIRPLYSFLLAGFHMIVKTTVLVFNPPKLGLRTIA